MCLQTQNLSDPCSHNECSIIQTIRLLNPHIFPTTNENRSLNSKNVTEISEERQNFNEVIPNENIFSSQNSSSKDQNDQKIENQDEESRIIALEAELALLKKLIFLMRHQLIRKGCIES